MDEPRYAASAAGVWPWQAGPSLVMMATALPARGPLLIENITLARWGEPMGVAHQ